METNNTNANNDSSYEVALELDYVVSDYDEVEERRFHEEEDTSVETDIDFDY